MNRSTDDLDDVTLPQRPRRPEARGEYRSDLRSEGRAGSRDDLRDDVSSQDREFTLSTGTVLGLFFGLALVCAVFFGFGYSMGRKSATAAAIPAADTTAGSDAAAAGAGDSPAANKPSAGSPAIQAIPAYQSSQKDSDSSTRSASPAAAKAPASSGSTTVTVPMDSTAEVKPRKAPVDPDSQIVEAPRTTLTRPVLVPSTPAPTAPAAASANPTATAGGAAYVQIAAVSHKEDADVLLNALKRRGYNVFTRSGDTDKLIHVQVGPFATKKDAEAMRQKLLGDGYNAILK